MNARPPCLASRDEAAHAARQGEYDAEDEALSDYVLEHYGPPWAAEFVEEALHAAPYSLARTIAESGHYPTICVEIDNWLRIYAGRCGRRDMQEARNAAR